jgi:hypothetical protein
MIEILIVVSIVETTPLSNFFNNISYGSLLHLIVLKRIVKQPLTLSKYATFIHLLRIFTVVIRLSVTEYTGVARLTFHHIFLGVFLLVVRKLFA